MDFIGPSEGSPPRSTYNLLLIHHGLTSLLSRKIKFPCRSCLSTFIRCHTTQTLNRSEIHTVRLLVVHYSDPLTVPFWSFPEHTMDICKLDVGPSVPLVVFGHSSFYRISRDENIFYIRPSSSVPLNNPPFDRSILRQSQYLSSVRLSVTVPVLPTPTRILLSSFWVTGPRCVSLQVPSDKNSGNACKTTNHDWVPYFNREST